MTDYEQAYRDLRAGVEALADHLASRGCDSSDLTHPHEPTSYRSAVCPECLSVDLAALLASSAPTASEDATLSDSVTDSVTSSDGDRGLSDEEREAVLRAHVHISPAALFGVIERILAARTAQPEGVERVEYVAETERGRLVNFGARSWEARRFAVTQDVVLWRRTIATRRGPWEVVGDE